MTTKRTSAWFATDSSWSRSTCCEASPSPVSPITTNEKSPAPTSGGLTAKLAGPALPPSANSTSRTIASRHVSVRDSAQEFHIPAAQFSVSKYQLMPQTGTVAARIAAIGSPRRSPRPSVAGIE
jgi:hypothetical protein